MPVFNADIVNSAKAILIVTPFISKSRGTKMMQLFKVALEKNIEITIITRPPECYDKPNWNNAFRKFKYCN